jgi:isoleucyl-tRNA synthetase
MPRDYKDTVNLPRTEFPMRGNLTQLEPRMLAWWEQKRVFARMVEQNASRPLFVFHDGPPYANGHLHAGTALNKILKDFVVKFRNLSGSLCDFVPGWDCHGLPIEQAVEKRLKDKKIDRRLLSRDEFLERCREYALEFIDIQRSEFKRLGVFGRWDDPYKTLSFDYEAQEIRELATFARRGSLYRQKKPVYWCLVDRTALAEAEVEYEDHTSPSIYVAFDAVDDLSSRWTRLAGKRVSLAIWTTTPWTLPANLAIAVHPKFEYVFYELRSRVICVAKDLLHSVLSALRPELTGAENSSEPIEPSRILASVGAKELEGLRYRHPFIDRISKVILADHVTLEQGTGLVHTAPGHGQEDYEIGLANGLDVYSPIGDDGRFDQSVEPRLSGKKVFEANPLIIAWLLEAGALLNSPKDQLKHSYPHCWRCHNPVIFRATPQWFISLDKTGLRKRALEEIDRVEWIPRWGRDRIYGMLENRPDWCISRQREWGVPLPLGHCESCGEPLISAEMMERVAAAVEKDGTGVWYRAPISEFLPPGVSCAHCGQSRFRKETDILDVWFDSACSFSYVTAKYPRTRFPIDLYLEGSDQHRGWFHSSLLVSVGTRDQSPYRSCLTHGFTVDGEGRKMSKSLGNVVTSEELVKRYGAEIVRLWVASADYQDDIRLSDQILKGLMEGYRRIRNTLRYALSNLYDFDPEKHAVPPERLLPLDRWARARMAGLVERVRRAYEDYEFHIVYHQVVDFCAIDLSALYFDILKDRLYTASAGSEKRRGAQTVLYDIARDLSRLLAPITSFTAEEVWQFLPATSTESVFLAGLPEPAKGLEDPELMDTFDRLFAVRSEVQKLLEVARRDKQIGSSLEAQLVLWVRGPAAEFLLKHESELATLFIVSQVKVLPSSGSEREIPGQPLALSGSFWSSSSLYAQVSRAVSQKCPRCWKYREEVGRTNDLCAECAEALNQAA